MFFIENLQNTVGFNQQMNAMGKFLENTADFSPQIFIEVIYIIWWLGNKFKNNQVLPVFKNGPEKFT